MILGILWKIMTKWVYFRKHVGSHPFLRRQGPAFLSDIERFNKEIGDTRVLVLEYL